MDYYSNVSDANEDSRESMSEGDEYVDEDEEVQEEELLDVEEADEDIEEEEQDETEQPEDEEEVVDYEKDLEVLEPRESAAGKFPATWDADSMASSREALKFFLTRDINHRVIRAVPKEARRSSNILQKHEFTEAIGVRASQIEHGAPVFTDVSGCTSAIEMAVRELVDRKNPFVLVRPRRKKNGERVVEEFAVRDMVYDISERYKIALSNKQIEDLK